MICQQCNQKPANVEMKIQGHTRYLCEPCFRENKNRPDELLHFFNQLFAEETNHHTNNTNLATKNNNRNSILDRLGTNLNEAAKEGKFKSLIGRENEINQAIETLCRLEKNNPVFIGEAGVGKTAIAEGIAQRIVDGKVDRRLRQKVIYNLNVSSLMKGTQVRGSLEQILDAVIREVEDHGNVLLFIDEIHLLVGAGAAEGSMDIANILKPVLARGDISVMGATTLKEYRIIEKDSALERRFQPIHVKEPSTEEALAIAKGVKTHFENHHRVSFTDEALEACVKLSKRYIRDRFLPDKAIDLLDAAGAKVSLRSAGSELDYEQNLAFLRQEKAKAVREQQFELAEIFRKREAELIKQSQNMPFVTEEDIQDVIEQKTGIPVKKLQENQRDALKNLPKILSERVIGQPKAVETIAKSIKRQFAGLKDKHKPSGSFLFYGPTGVGKTETAKVIAEQLFGERESLIRLDMSEYAEAHSVSKLIGSPPGYVGFNDGGGLTEKIYRHPYSVILVDELEKAHPNVRKAFLQILDDGRLTDSHGKVVSFEETIIIMTSNAGVSNVKKKGTLGFGSDEKDIYTSELDDLKGEFEPEFLNRFDAVVKFNALGEKELVQIVDLQLNKLTEKLAERNIKINVSHPAKKWIAEEAAKEKDFGARPIRRVIQRWIEDQVADLLIDQSETNEIYVGSSKQKKIYVK